MEKLNIIAKAPAKDVQSEKDTFYWVPCMVQTNGLKYAQTLGKGEDLIMTPALCFVSKTKFIHVGVFHRLLALCLTKWQPSMMGNEYLFFNGLCEFELNKDHVLVLSLNDYVIQANVIRYSTRKDNPELSLYITTREYLFTALREIADLLCPACEFDICIQCSKSPPLSNEGLHEIKDLQDIADIRCAKHKSDRHCVRSADLLGIWQENGASVPTILQTVESAYATNRFVKIYSLLVYLGSKVLRQLLNDKAVEQNLTLDQYLQRNENDIDKLRKNKVFSKVQIDIIFPTNGHTDLGKYDIALSSALLLNIFPSLKDEEKHKVKDIRKERNKFSHAQSTKMRSSEYEIKWTMVTTTLTDLSKLCQGDTFKAEVQREIQQIKESVDLNSVLEKYYEDLKKDMEDLRKEIENLKNNNKSEVRQADSRPEEGLGDKAADQLAQAEHKPE